MATPSPSSAAQCRRQQGAAPRELCQVPLSHDFETSPLVNTWKVKGCSKLGLSSSISIHLRSMQPPVKSQGTSIHWPKHLQSVTEVMTYFFLHPADSQSMMEFMIMVLQPTLSEAWIAMSQGFLPTTKGRGPVRSRSMNCRRLLCTPCTLFTHLPE